MLMEAPSLCQTPFNSYGAAQARGGLAKRPRKGAKRPRKGAPRQSLPPGWEDQLRPPQPSTPVSQSPTEAQLAEETRHAAILASEDYQATGMAWLHDAKEAERRLRWTERVFGAAPASAARADGAPKARRRTSTAAKKVGRKASAAAPPVIGAPQAAQCPAPCAPFRLLASKTLTRSDCRGRIVVPNADVVTNFTTWARQPAAR